MVAELDCRVSFPECKCSDRIDKGCNSVAFQGTKVTADDHRHDYHHDCRIFRRTIYGLSKTHINWMIAQRRAPVIVFLGWYGSRYKDLAKYSSIYRSRPCITIEYTHNYLRGREKLKDVATKVLESFFELGLQDHPIFFHLFSGGGGYIYGHVTAIVHGPEPGKYASLDIRGMIMDSVPSPILPRTVYQVIVAMMPSVFPWIVDALIAFMITVIYRVTLLMDKSQQHKLDVYYQTMIDDPMRCPQLFLYSKADKIAPFTDVQAAIAGRRQRGVKVHEVCWEDTSHIRHLKKHEEEYVNACLDFVDACLKEENVGSKMELKDKVSGAMKRSKL